MYVYTAAVGEAVALFDEYREENAKTVPRLVYM